MATDGLIDALAQTAFSTTAILTRIGAEHDLSLTQLRMLGILRDRRLRMSELADYLGLEKSTITGLVDRAAKRGLLQRAPTQGDGRVLEVHTTPDGAALVTRLYRELAHALAPMIGTLSAAEQRRLQALLERTLGSR